MKLGLAIVHAPWKPERVKSMQRLRDQLSVEAPGNIEYFEETTRAANWAWSDIMWKRAASHANVDAWIFLQDDVEVDIGFWKTIETILEMRTESVIGLSCAHPAARRLFIDGIPGYRVVDEILGFGYVMRRDALFDFLRWRETELVDGGFQRLTEDSLVALYCMARRQPIFHPVPSPIDHDLTIDSTYGNDANIYRKPQVTFRDYDRLLPQAETGRPMSEAVPYFARFYQSLHEWLPVLLRDKALGAELYDYYVGQECPKEHRRFFTRVNGAPRP